MGAQLLRVGRAAGEGRIANGAHTRDLVAERGLGVEVVKGLEVRRAFACVTVSPTMANVASAANGLMRVLTMMSPSFSRAMIRDGPWGFRTMNRRDGPHFVFARFA